MSFTVTAEPHTQALHDAISDVLVRYNDGAGGPHGWTPLALVVRDTAGGLAGGLWAEWYFDWMFVKLLVVPDAARGRGLGTELMRRAEEAALGAGLTGIWLDTFSFQARPFYERLGYAVFGTLEDHPRGGVRYFMQKRLGPREP